MSYSIKLHNIDITVKKEESFLIFNFANVGLRD